MPKIRFEKNGFDCEIFTKKGIPSGFEIYSIEDPEDYYAEGEIVIEGNEITDYDGVYELPKEIEEKLNELGYKL